MKRLIFFLLSMYVLSSKTFEQNLLNPQLQPQFVNPLPIPTGIDAKNGGTLTMHISQFKQWLGLIDPVSKKRLYTTVWGYNNTYPGPTILARTNKPIEVYWQNDLMNSLNQPLPHLLPIDPTIHWALEKVPGWQTLGVPVVTHLHGGHTESASDGLPEAWYTPNFTLKGKDFKKGDLVPYHYSNNQEAATIWYHDHALGITRLNVYAGLAGFYLITDDNEEALEGAHQLPAPPYDMALAIQDRMFTSEGQLFFPSGEREEEGSSILPEMFGNFILVNGLAWPVLEVEPRQYRFRLLNGSDSRFYNLFLSSGQSFSQVGADDGLLPTPVIESQILLGPGERKDVILDFSDPAYWGQTIILRNNAKTPYPRGKAVDPQTTGRIMAFKVSKPLNQNYPLTQLPALLRAPIEKLKTDRLPRQLILFDGEDELGRLEPQLGTIEHGAMEWHDPVTEKPLLNSTEIWEIYNETMDAHPIHLHMVRMQLISRQKFTAQINDETGKPANIRLPGQPILPAPEEQGWKDTWVSFPGEVLKVIAKFDLEGLYVWHCHILSHEDHEMMQPFSVIRDELLTRKTKPNEPVDSLLVGTYPNPFNNVLTIALRLPKSSSITIRIYDGAGRLIKELAQPRADEGLHTFTVDASRWAKGLYTCEVQTSDGHMSKAILHQ